MAYSTQSDKTKEDYRRFQRAMQMLFRDASTFFPDKFEVSVTNGIFHPDHIAVDFSGKIDDETYQMIMGAFSDWQVDDERLSEISREFADTLFLKSL